MLIMDIRKDASPYELKTQTFIVPTVMNTIIAAIVAYRAYMSFRSSSVSRLTLRRSFMTSVSVVPRAYLYFRAPDNFPHGLSRSIP